METKKILLADDENSIVQIMAAKLRNNCFEVVTADNGKDAFKLCCEQKPDIVVVDCELPELSGVELAEKIHKKNGLAEVVIIMITTKETELNAEQAEKAGITECLNKPFSPKELLTRIENVLASATTK